MVASLPKKLRQEPLIDALFEVRFSSKSPTSVIFPGVLFNSLPGSKEIVPLSAAQMPKQIRDADPVLKFAPVARLDWGQFAISISDFSVLVGCKLPYPGWINFRPVIILVMDELRKTNIVQNVERYSLKYVDLIPGIDPQQQISFVNFEVNVAGHNLEKEIFQFRIEILKDGFINAVNLVSSATVTVEGQTAKHGLVIDIDTIANQNNIPLLDVLVDFPAKLDQIHESNKQMFFDCLNSKALALLEPIYE